MKLTFLGACRQVGRSMFQADTGSLKLLLDAGTTTFAGDRFPMPPKGKIDAAILSHAHMDHSGFVPQLFHKGRIPWYCTPPTLRTSNLLWRDAIKVAILRRESPYITEPLIREANKHAVQIPYAEEYEFFDGTSFELFDAGHIPGSAQVIVNSGKQKLLYTGDFNSAKTRLHNGCVPGTRSADAMIIESTYAMRNHPPRKDIETELAVCVKEAITTGNALIPCFAIGRTLEVLMALRAKGITRVFVDGMGVAASQIVADYPEYVSDPDAMASALASCKFVENNSARKAIGAGKGNVIIATAGMLDGGPALSYIKAMNAAGRGMVLMPGYQGAGTNGRSLVETGIISDHGIKFKINLPVKVFDFSAHAGRKELFDFVRKAEPKKVFCVHGDEATCITFASELTEQGFDATAPKLGDSVVI